MTEDALKSLHEIQKNRGSDTSTAGQLRPDRHETHGDQANALESPFATRTSRRLDIPVRHKTLAGQSGALESPFATQSNHPGFPSGLFTDLPTTPQTTGHSRPRRMLGMPAIHENSSDNYPVQRRGGEPVPGRIRDCLATRRWVATNNVEQTRLPHPTHTDEDGGGCPVVREGDATSSAQTTGHSRPRRILSLPAMYEKLGKNFPGKRRGGEPVPGRIRDCLATRRWVATNNVEQTRLPHTTHTHEDGGGCPVISDGDATYTVQSARSFLHPFYPIHPWSTKGGTP